MQRHHVESSSINSVGYDPRASSLEIEFTGGDVYAYHDVPQETYERLITADSKGRFVNYEIKPNYRFTKISHPSA